MTEAIYRLILEDCGKSCRQLKSFSALANQTILITGGTGFMGKWLSEMISFINESNNLGIKLILLARDIEKFRHDVPHLARKPFISYLEQDIRNLHDLPKEINYIIHAAGSPDNREHVSQPLKTVETFYKGTQAVLDAATRLPEIKKFIHISSHQVYGGNESDVLLDENFSGKLDLSNVYTESKRITETLCGVYRHQFRLPIITIRPFAFIGPYHDLEKPWAINNFIRDGILGGPIRIIGNGLTVRSYLYGSDMACWILEALVNGKVGESYNLGSNAAITLEDLAQKVKEALSNNIEILFKSSKENYSSSSKLVPDISKIVKDLGVSETYKLEEVIKRTIVWNQLNRSNNKI